jgi:ferric-dicitrate binding protein FerR (iron transport regulator)
VTAQTDRVPTACFDAFNCPYGTVTVRQAQWNQICAPGAFAVTVHIGAVRVTARNGVSREVERGNAVAFDFSTGKLNPVAPLLPPEALRAFRLQAAALHLG